MQRCAVLLQAAQLRPAACIYPSKRILPAALCGAGEPIVVLRSDIDALPIQEPEAGLAYASRNSGRMHACGHDAHMVRPTTHGC